MSQFCERALRASCSDLGWIVDRLVMRPTAVHLLAIVPAALTRDQLTGRLQRAAGRVARRAGLVPAGDEPLWEGRCWCAVLSNAAKVDAVRRHLERANSSEWGRLQASRGE